MDMPNFDSLIDPILERYRLLLYIIIGLFLYAVFWMVKNWL